MEEEINLIDCIRVISKKKGLILKFFLGFIIIFVISGLVLPKTYKAKTILEIGEFAIMDEKKEFCPEKPIQLVEKIKNGNYNEKIKENLKIKKISALESSSPENTGLVIISSKSSSSLEAENILKALNSLIIKEHKEKFDRQKSALSENKKRLKNKINSLGKEEKILENKKDYLISVFAAEPSINNQLILLETKKNLEEKKSEINDYYLELNYIQKQLNASKLTTVLKTPSASISDLWSNPLIIIIYLMLALTIGIIIAFIANWWEKEKK